MPAIVEYPAVVKQALDQFGHLSHIGPVRMVVSKRPRGPWKKCIAIVTNETGLKARQVVEVYECRWLIEVLFKELAQDLGLGDYQMRKPTGGIVKCRG